MKWFAVMLVIVGACSWVFSQQVQTDSASVQWVWDNGTWRPAGRLRTIESVAVVKKVNGFIVEDITTTKIINHRPPEKVSTISIDLDTMAKVWKAGAVDGRAWGQWVSGYSGGYVFEQPRSREHPEICPEQKVAMLIDTINERITPDDPNMASGLINLLLGQFGYSDPNQLDRRGIDDNLRHDGDEI